MTMRHWAWAIAWSLAGGAAALADDAGSRYEPPPPMAAAAAPIEPPAGGARAGRGAGVLPNEHGQVWREYDIAPYTNRVNGAPKPEQAIVDWVLRVTGTEMWFQEPLGILSANRSTLRVYHTPQVQESVVHLLDRFVNAQAESQVFGVRLVTVGSPNWRTKAQGILQPVNVQSPGLEAWITSKENSALLLAELRKRSDYAEHSAPNLLIYNGQSHTIAKFKPRNYIRGVVPRPNTLPPYQMEMGQIQEGYSLVLSPLMEIADPSNPSPPMVEAVIKAEVDQVEKMASVYMEAPGGGPKLEIQVPQMSSWKLHERFRWPSDQVLVLSRGVVATPKAGATPTGVSNPFSQVSAGRADALLFVYSNGKVSQTLINPNADPSISSANNRGRY